MEEQEPGAAFPSIHIMAALRMVEHICDKTVEIRLKLEDVDHLAAFLCGLPTHMIEGEFLRQHERRGFIQTILGKGIVDVCISMVEAGEDDMAVSAVNLLALITHGTEIGAQAVSVVFDRVVSRFDHIFSSLPWGYLGNLPLLDAVVLLCSNVAAMCPSTHTLLLDVVQPVCVRIVTSPQANDHLRANTIVLLANLSLTLPSELRALGVADVLLELVVSKSESPISVAESIIIFLHGHEKCEMIDTLMKLEVIDTYCVPLLRATLNNQMFRSMFPYLLYSVRVFRVLASSAEYAQALAFNEEVIPLLIKSCVYHRSCGQMESNFEGAALALQTLRLFVKFGFWPRDQEEADHVDFLLNSLPSLCDDSHAGVRAAAVALWSQLHPGRVVFLQLVGMHTDFPQTLWKRKILTFLYPLLCELPKT